MVFLITLPKNNYRHKNLSCIDASRRQLQSALKIWSEIHLSPAYKSKVGNATPHSEHAQHSSFHNGVAAIQSPIVKTLTIGTLTSVLVGTCSFGTSSVLVFGTRSHNIRDLSIIGRWPTVADGRGRSMFHFVSEYSILRTCV